MRLVDACPVIRSKNAGPTRITLDLMFRDRAAFELARQSPALAPARIAPLYGLESHEVTVVPYAPANAIKLVLERRTIAGEPGDRDVYGAQQHGPLLGVEL